MRKALLLPLITLLSLLGAEIIQIGNGTLTNQSLPIEAARNFSFSQQVYLASQINSSGLISSIAFQYSVSGSLFYQNNSLWQVWLGHTNRDFLEGWVPLDSLSLVYDGTLSPADFSGGLPGQGWLTIELDTPFFYNGDQNLLVAVDENSPGSSSTADEFLCFATPVVRGIVFTDMNINPDPAALPPTYTFARNSAPNLRLELDVVNYTPHQPLPPDQASGVEPDSPLAWQSDAASFDLWLGTSQQNLALVASGLAVLEWNPPEPWQLLQTYYWQVIGHHGGEIYPGALWSFTIRGEGISPPQNLSGFFNDDHVQLAWQPPQTGNVDHYRVFRNNQFFAICAGTSYQDYEVQSGITYHYFVKAVNPLGELSDASNTVSVHVPGTIPDLILAQGFEQCIPFSQVIPGWLNLDLDGSPTWSWDEADFPGEGESLAWLCFAPALTQPPLTGVLPQQGTQMALAMSSLNPPNSDWLISPRLNLGEQPRVSFWARSHTADYGLERLRLLISTTDADPASFVSVSSCGYIPVPAEWTEYEYDLLYWKNQSVHLAWQCVSWDSFALYLDNIIITGQGGFVGNSDALAPSVTLKAYPNPTSGDFSISNPAKLTFDLALYDLRGRLLLKQKGITAFHSGGQGVQLPAGVYLLKLSCQDQTFLQRISVIK